MDILDKFFEMRRVSEGTNKMILIFVKPKYLEEMSLRFEMAMVDVSGQPGFIFSGNDVRTLNREYDGDLIDLMFYAPEWKSVSDIKKFLDKDDLEPIHDWNFVLDESKIREGVGDLPAGYTDEDLAEFLDKEEKNPFPMIDMEDDNDYDPNDEVVQFIYNNSTPSIQGKIEDSFESGYLDDSSMATISELRKFIMDNELDVEDFRIFDTKGEEYFDKLALVYDIVPDNELQDTSKIHESTKKSTKRLNESLVAGPNGLIFSNETRTAKHDAADKLLRKIGKIPSTSAQSTGKLNETVDLDADINPEREFKKVMDLILSSSCFIQLEANPTYQYWKTTNDDPIEGNGIIVTFEFDRRVLEYDDYGTLCTIRSNNVLERFSSGEDGMAYETLKDLIDKYNSTGEGARAAFYDSFYDLCYDHPDGDSYWHEASAEDGIDLLNTFKKDHPNIDITQDEAVEMYQNFISDRLDI